MKCLEKHRTNKSITKDGHQTQNMHKLDFVQFHAFLADARQS